MAASGKKRRVDNKVFYFMRFTARIVFACLLLCIRGSMVRAQQPKAAQEKPFSVASLARLGDPAPNGGVFSYCGSYVCAITLSGHHPLNNSGAITFYATATDPAGFSGPSIYLA
ncbi:MAG: hypothetical protein ACREDR_46035, partial [Blastocatellia bacterium]